MAQSRRPGSAMSAALDHFRRYLCWAGVGACLALVMPPGLLLLMTGLRDPAVCALAVLAGAAGAALFVLLRMIVGWVTRWPPRVADRAMVVWLGRFFIGWFLGIWVMMGFLEFLKYNPAAKQWLAWGLWSLAFWHLAGIAMVLTGWLAGRRRGWLIVPIA